MSFSRDAFKSSYGEERPAFFWWYPQGTSTKEKKLLAKIDFFILTYCCFGYFAKWLDQANLSNASVSGMREDLSLYGNEYTLANTLLNIGSIIGGIPSNLLITWLPPRYKRTELGKRTAIFTSSSYVGTAVGAYIFSGVLAGMDGYRGYPAWRWAFVVDGIMTIVIGICGLVVLPDTPDKTTAFYLSAEERQRCVDRLVEDDRQPVGTFSWDLCTRVLTSWQFYVLSVLWVFWETTVGKVGNTAFQLFLKYDAKHQWSLYDINDIPTAINGFNIIMIMLTDIYADATGRRTTAALSTLTLQLLGTLCLVIWNIPLALHILAYLAASCDGPLSPLYMAWANLLCGGDQQVRAATLAMMNALGNATTTVVQQVAYPVGDAPEYRVGSRTSLGLGCGMVLWVLVVRWCEWRVQREPRGLRGVCGETVYDGGGGTGSDVAVGSVEVG